MPISYEGLIDPVTGDPSRFGGSGGQINPGGIPPGGFFGGGGPGGYGGYSGGPGYAPGAPAYTPRRRIMTGGSPLSVQGGGRYAQPNIGLPSGWRPGGGLPGQPGARYGGGAGSPAPMPAAPSGGGVSGFWNGIEGLPADPGSWDIPQFNRFSALIAAGDPRLRGTAFDPNGDPNVLQGIHDWYGQNALDRENSALLGAYQDAPNDPGVAGYARLKARLGARSDASRAASDYRMQAAQRAQALREQLLGNITGSNLQHGLATQQGLLNQYQQNANQPGFWDYAAPIIGAGLGGWAGGGFKMPGRTQAGR